MTKIHRELLETIVELEAVNLDSAYGFQLNVPQMSEKLEEYFATSLNVTLTLCTSPPTKEPQISSAPSLRSRCATPTMCLRDPGVPPTPSQWAPLHFGDDLLSVLDKGGTLCISSAASLTLGAFTAPIYEIYKVGDQHPHWRDGLNVLGALASTVS